MNKCYLHKHFVWFWYVLVFEQSLKQTGQAVHNLLLGQSLSVVGLLAGQPNKEHIIIELVKSVDFLDPSVFHVGVGVLFNEYGLHCNSIRRKERSQVVVEEKHLVHCAHLNRLNGRDFLLGE